MEKFINKKVVFSCFLMAIVIFSFVVLNLTEVAAASKNKPVKLKVATYITSAYGDAFYSVKRMADYINYNGKNRA